jgi:hypothetical protein
MASSYTMDDLMADLKKSAYNPKTSEELQQEANNRYDTIYTQKNLAAQQAADTSSAALERQLKELSLTNIKQREASQKAYDSAYSQTNNQSLSRGMQRSSFNNSTLGNIAIAGNKALQEINSQESTTKTGIEDQKTLIAQQLAQQLQQYAEGKASDTNAYLDQLLSQEYDRQQAANEQANAISQQLYANSYQQQRDTVADTQWDKLHPKSSGTAGRGKQSNWVIDGINYKTKAAYNAELQRRQDKRDTNLANRLKPNGYGQIIVSNGVPSYITGR